MLSLLTPAQMRQLDAHMINEQGIPEEVLMEQAAMGVTAAVEALLPLGGRVFVFCGSWEQRALTAVLICFALRPRLPAWQGCSIELL